MIDQRSFDEIRAAHPMPWRFVTAPGLTNGMAQIVCIDNNGVQVQLSVLLRVIDIITHKAAQAPAQP